MNFRELTNQECQLTRQWIPAEAKRKDADILVLSGLDAAIARYIEAGGAVRNCPAFAFSSNDSIVEMNRAQKRAATERNNAKTQE